MKCEVPYIIMAKSFIDASINLKYGEKVYVGLPNCECNEAQHNVKHTKLASGYLRAKNEETGRYVVELIATKGSNATSIFSELVCSCTGVTSCIKEDGTSSIVLKDVAPEDLYVTSLEKRELPYTNSYGEEFVLKIGDDVNIFPLARKQSIITFNSDFTKMLVIDYQYKNQLIYPLNEMRIIELGNADIIITVADGAIPYDYKVYKEDGQTELDFGDNTEG